MIKLILLITVIIGVQGENLLDDVSKRYSQSEGIQWEIESIVYSDIFEEADTSFINFRYSSPDTFSLTSENELIIGIGDTLWVKSMRHKQIQKKIMDSSMLPYNFIINWRKSYKLIENEKSDENYIFKLQAIPGYSPEKMIIKSDNNQRILNLFYVDTKGDEVTMTIIDETLNRPSGFNLFYKDIPDDYDYIDLIE
jgi:hypothetical protein